MSKLSGKVTVVTGASRAVGKGIAEELGIAGAIVYVTGRSVKGRQTTDNLPGTVDETAVLVEQRGGQGIPVQYDHTNDEQVAALFKRIDKERGRLDLLVNNVWGGYEQYDAKLFDGPFWKQPLEYWHRMFDSGVRAHFTSTRLAAPMMIEAKRGFIINISAGDRQKFLHAVIYDLAKNAIDRLTYGVARKLREYGIAALSLYPGFTRTERVLSEYKGDLSATESPRCTGRAVVALAQDDNVLEKTGKSFAVGDLAEEYGFTDIDGRQVPAFYLPDK